MWEHIIQRLIHKYGHISALPLGRIFDEILVSASAADTSEKPPYKRIRIFF